MSETDHSSISTEGSLLSTKRFTNYVYDIKHTDKVNLMNILLEELKNNPNLWQKMAKILKIQQDDINAIKQDTLSSVISSPFEDILKILSDQARSCNELYAALYKLKQFKAMKVIKPYVDESLLEKIKARNSAIHPTSVLTLPNISLLLNNLTLNQPKNESVMSSSMNLAELKFGIPEVPYEELTLATNNWDEANTLGQGGFGIVFKGNWKNTLVAIKRIKPKKNNEISKDDFKTELKQSMNELKFLNACRHDNVLGLYGYCLTGEYPCLVYQLMPNGTLEQHLFKQEKTLQWNQKYFIALGTARGLQFLHTFKEKPLIHGDIKPANILLGTYFNPMIGDFGLARESPSRKPIEISKAYGTRPYLPPEFIQTRRLSTKIDTFSFGIVLFELATRKRVIDKERKPEHLIKLMNLHFEQKIKPEDVIDLKHQIDEVAIQIFSVLTVLGKTCTSLNADERPEMVDVLKRLEGN